MKTSKLSKLNHKKSILYVLVLSFLSVPGVFASGPYKLMVFTGSDWCRTCKKMDKNLFSDSGFTDSLQKLGVSINMIDFPKYKKLPDSIIQRNNYLSEKLKFTGHYPSFYLLNLSDSSSERVNYRNDEMTKFLQKISERVHD